MSTPEAEINRVFEDESQSPEYARPAWFDQVYAEVENDKYEWIREVAERRQADVDST